MGKILDDAKDEKEQGNRNKDGQEPREEFGKILGRFGSDAEERKQIREQRSHYNTT